MPTTPRVMILVAVTTSGQRPRRSCPGSSAARIPPPCYPGLAAAAAIVCGLRRCCALRWAACCPLRLDRARLVLLLCRQWLAANSDL